MCREKKLKQHGMSKNICIIALAKV
jgi:hypothetical protein